MNLVAPFVMRPVATTLLAVGVMLAGALGLRMLPVSPLPQLDFPTISVSASLPGASPEVMAATVATPLERALGAIAGVSELTSSSSLGSTRITVQFDLDRDIDGAARDVQAAINAARALLPTSLPNNPTYRKVNPADAPIMILALTSATMTRGQLYDVAATVLAQKLSQVRGVGQVDVGGSSLPAVRVALSPTAISRYGIALEEVRTAIAANNANRPKGSLDDGERHWQIQANDQARTAADYVPLVIAYREGAALRLGDIAEVSDSVQDVRNAGMSNGKPSVLLIIRRQPNANIIDTIDRVYDVMPLLRASVPAAVDLDVVSDRSPTIRSSLREVERSLLVSIVCVVLVVFVFLRSVRAAIVPSVAVPLSLAGTFGLMYLAGFSLNILSLMALTVATGFVVDDAVVVVENVMRHVEHGMSPLRAALRGAGEVGFTVLSMSVSLVAVFIPVLAMGGIAGRLFREFAWTMTAAILVSLVVSLTVTPMMCGRLLRARARGVPHDAGAPERAAHPQATRAVPAADPAGADDSTLAAHEPADPHASAGDRVQRAILRGYGRSLDMALAHPVLVLLTLAATVALNVWLYVIVPKSFFPSQDTGRLIGNLQADQTISFQAMQGKLADLMAIVRADPAVTDVVGFTGGGQRNRGFFFVSLKPLEERRVSADQVIARLRVQLARVPGANLFLVPVQDVRVGGRQANAQYQYTLQADDVGDLRASEPRVRRALGELPELVDVNTDQEDRGQQTTVTIDRDAAARLGVDVRTLDATLNDAFGQRPVSTIYNPLNQYRVVMEWAAPYTQGPESLGQLYVVTAAGAAVPLSAIATWGPGNAPLAVNHQGQFAASTISFNLAEGVSLLQATAAVEHAVARLALPATVHGSMQGTARAFQQSLSSQPILILVALGTIYIVLGVLYESTVHPLTILSTLPSAGVGALLALLATGTDFTLIALIGVMLLIGIVKKNAIMMIDFALDAERRLGLDSRAAIHRACLLRLRPILMTTVAAMLGAAALVLGSGEGASLRRPLGITIVGGLALSQLLTLYTTPVVYLALDRLRVRVLRRRRAGAVAHEATP